MTIMNWVKTTWKNCFQDYFHILLNIIILTQKMCYDNSNMIFFRLFGYFF
uniref:Uncharacterized protein n=1 Tax=Spiroplasma kunkelii TaxID=47834 RepID=Q6XYZ7_SPIKU|nr:hypothetical protein [Spiroplasma kunkelii CR2-3x]